MTQETLVWIQTPANAPDNAELEAWKALSGALARVPKVLCAQLR